MSTIRGRHLISVADLSNGEILRILDRATQLKREVSTGGQQSLLTRKIVGLLFEKPSTRTRVGFESAILQLGGEAMYLRGDELQLGRGEPIKDTARVLRGYLNGLVMRVYAHKTLTEFAEYARIPIINALSDLEHPTQILCDLLTLHEVKGRLAGLNLAWVGDGNNVCNSWVLGAAIMGINLKVACPKGFDPDSSIVKKALEIAKTTGARISIERDPRRASKDADVLYTDVWVSMGQEKAAKRKEKTFAGFQLNQRLVDVAKPDAIVMHCLPAHRGLEITEDVIEGPRSVVWQQSWNKMHCARGILAEILG